MQSSELDGGADQTTLLIIAEAVPKRILEFMNVPGLTRENVASHLQELWQRLQASVLRQKRDALFCFCFSCLLLVWVVIG